MRRVCWVHSIASSCETTSERAARTRPIIGGGTCLHTWPSSVPEPSHKVAKPILDLECAATSTYRFSKSHLLYDSALASARPPEANPTDLPGCQAEVHQPCCCGGARRLNH
eukprot:3086252-Amphidinium_carterae.3